MTQKDTPPTPPSREDIRRDLEQDPGRKDFYDIPDDPNTPLPPSGDPTRQ
jgi:hypothetical protein